MVLACCGRLQSDDGVALRQSFDSTDELAAATRWSAARFAEIGLCGAFAHTAPL